MFSQSFVVHREGVRRPARFTVVLGVLVAALASLVVGASGAQARVASPDTHPTHRVEVRGIVYTTAASLGASITIVTRADRVSVVRPLGRVTLTQDEAVVPDTFQGPTSVPASGRLSISAATLTAADGSTITYTGDWAPFQAVAAITEPSGLHPIAFAGDLTVTGGSGRFARATGTLHYAGEYSFTQNAGFFVVCGTLTTRR